MKKRYGASSPLFVLALSDCIGFAYLACQKTDRIELIATVSVGIMFLSLLMACYCLIRVLGMGDPYLFLPVAALLSVGILMLMRLSPDEGEKQMIWVVISAVVYFAGYFLYRAARHRSALFFLYAGISIALFIATLVFGKSVNGAKNWIFIGSQGFQPSELIRILYVLALAALMNKKSAEGLRSDRRKQELIAMAYMYLNLGFLILQREWGIAVLFFLIYLAMHFVFGKYRGLDVINLAAATLGIAIGYRALYHIRTRVDMWLNPYSDPTQRGYQIVQSEIAMASGGFLGAGFGNGRPELVPFVASDFIFSGICEEFGILGGIGVVLLFFILIYRAFKIALGTKDGFDKKVALGLSVMFSFQTFIILGGVVRLIPLTGITLPFISYGGSSLVTGFLALGILQAISRKEGDSFE